jgi:hypothetical protein
MADPDETKRETPPPSERKHKSSAKQPELFSNTFDAGTGEVVKFERIDTNGVRQERHNVAETLARLRCPLTSASPDHGF